MNTITLYRGPNCWMADMSEASTASDVLRLFGTHHIPTPCTLQADAVRVAQLVSDRSPDHRVVVKGASL